MQGLSRHQSLIGTTAVPLQSSRLHRPSVHGSVHSMNSSQLSNKLANEVSFVHATPVAAAAGLNKPRVNFIRKGLKPVISVTRSGRQDKLRV